ncbi:MAG: hypothetical protein IKU12_00590, partial [Oscillospiraceae bacterium]|nr:hypothetical protein [Oscillospiraceae bacterium]
MFDERAVSAYRSITAPSELKEKVMAAQKSAKTAEEQKKRKTLRLTRQLSAAAACLVLMVGVWSMTREQGSLESGIRAEVVDYETPGMVRMAEIGPVTVKLNVEFPEGAQLSCREGELLVQGEEDLTLISRGSAWRVDGDALVLWQVPAFDTAQTFELTVDAETGSVTVVLSYDTAENCWAVSFAEE